MTLVALAALSLAFSLPTGPGRASPAAAKMHHGPIPHGTYEQLWCEDEYNPATKKVEEHCVLPPFQADVEDMHSDACTYLGSFPAPGAGSRWACPDRMGANAEVRPLC